MKLLTCKEDVEFFLNRAKWGMPGPGQAHDVRNARSEVLFTHSNAKSNLMNLLRVWELKEMQFGF